MADFHFSLLKVQQWMILLVISVVVNLNKEKAPLVLVAGPVRAIANCACADRVVLCLTRTGQDPQEVRQEDRRTDPPALHPERNAGAILRYRRPVQARQGVRGDAGPAPAPKPAVCAKRRRRERRQRQRRQAGEAQRLAGQRQWHWGHGAGGNRGHGEHVHEEHGGRTQGAQGDKERELHSERILPAATTVRAELAAAVADDWGD